MRVEPVPAIVGHVAVPGDKSISHRAVLVGAIAEGETRILGFGRSAGQMIENWVPALLYFSQVEMP